MLLDKEHIVFPEIDFDKIDEDWGLDVVITTTAEQMQRPNLC